MLQITPNPLNNSSLILLLLFLSTATGKNVFMVFFAVHILVKLGIMKLGIELLILGAHITQTRASLTDGPLCVLVRSVDSRIRS